MSSPTPPGSDLPKKSALKGDDDGGKDIPAGGSTKAVQIAEQAQTPPDDDAQFKKQFPAGVGRRLSGRRPVPTSTSKASLIGQNNLDNFNTMISAASSVSAAEDSGSAQPEHRHRINRASEKLLARVADWLEHEKSKKEKRRPKKASPRRKFPTSGTPTGNEAAAESGRNRAGSLDSESSDVSFDRLQRILDDSMAAFGLNSVPRFGPRLGRRQQKKSLKSFHLSRTASSDTEYFDGDALVPGCDAYLDNSKATSYQGGKAAADEGPSSSSKKGDKESQAWTTFKNDIIRMSHTLRLKGWRRVPMGSGDRIAVERLSGALTNAVYVVTPPEDLAPVPEGRKPPTKVLLRVYGPHVDIDRENELSVLQRLARKKIGPRLLGTFENGRFEQFFNATPLTPSTMRDPDTSQQIAKRMRELHDGIELLEEEIAEGPQVWKNWDRWLEQVERSVTALDKQVLREDSIRGTGDAWKRGGFICGVEWPIFKAMVDKYRKHLDNLYGGPQNIRERLVFSHNDTQYGNILRVRPENKKSPLLRPANEHKQLIVIDFEYAGANVIGLEFANHFTEWMYNYCDPVASFACNTAAYPTPEQQFRFAKAYVDHRPQYPHAGATPSLSPLLTPQTSSPSSPPSGAAPSAPGHTIGAAAASAATTGTTPVLPRAGSTSSIIEFMLDARAPAANAGGNLTAEDVRREEESDRRAAELLEEARLWRVANTAHWVAWGIVQARVLPGAVARDDDDDDSASKSGAEDDDDGADEGFDYLSYAQDRAFFFWGDCVLAGLVKMEELPQALREAIKFVHY